MICSHGVLCTEYIYIYSYNYIGIDIGQFNY